MAKAKRVSTSSLIEIGQCWQLRRTKDEFRVYQVHRKQRVAQLLPAAFEGIPKGRDTIKVGLAELRARYRLIQPIQQGKDFHVG